MENRINNTTDLGAYNTAIKDIAGVSEVSTFYSIFRSLPPSGEAKNQAIEHHLVDIRTEKARKKVAWAINNTLLQFYNQDHQSLLQGLFKEGVASNDLHLGFFWHFALSNRLFREISINVFSPVYYSGRASISQDDIIPFVKEIKKPDGSPLWADETIYRIATKYLSLATKLNFVTPGRVKSFKHIRPSSEAQVLFLYFAKLLSPNASNILTNEFLPISFVPSEDVQDRLKRLSLKGFFNMNFNGVALNIELTHSYKGICDALYN